jgi:hypothetical protein
MEAANRCRYLASTNRLFNSAMFRAVVLAPKLAERIAKLSARPLRAGASVGSSMRSFANGICAKLTTVANSKRGVTDSFHAERDRHILDISRISTT